GPLEQRDVRLSVVPRRRGAGDGRAGGGGDASLRPRGLGDGSPCQGTRRPRLEAGGPSFSSPRRPRAGGRRPDGRGCAVPAVHGGGPTLCDPRTSQSVAASSFRPGDVLATRPRPADPLLSTRSGHVGPRPQPAGGTRLPRPDGHLLSVPVFR